MKIQDIQALLAPAVLALVDQRAADQGKGDVWQLAADRATAEEPNNENLAQVIAACRVQQAVGLIPSFEYTLQLQVVRKGGLPTSWASRHPEAVAPSPAGPATPAPADPAPAAPAPKAAPVNGSPKPAPTAPDKTS